MITLFDTDAKKSVFSASIGSFTDNTTVNLYPRKSQPGWVWVVWGAGIAEIGSGAIIAEGILIDGPIDMAAIEAVRNAFKHVQ